MGKEERLHFRKNLPKWSQEMIDDLEKREARACRVLDGLTNRKKSRVWVDCLTKDSGEESFYLPDEALVEFKVPGQGVIRASIKGDRLEIWGERLVTIELSGAQNVFFVRAARE